MAHNLSSAPLPSGAVLLPEWLRSHGFVTAAVTENGAISRSRGFGRGFSIHKESRETESSSHRRTIETTFGQGLALISKLKDQRFFMFLHTYKPHNPYLPPVRYAKMFGNVDPGFKRSKVHTNWTPLNYDREIRYVDDQVRKLFQTLEREGVLENTIVVFTSDHGEAFLEHGYFAHGAIVYDEVLRVPLMLSGPGIPKGLRVREPVSLLDLMPSLLELLEVESPEGLMGRSYRGLLMAPGEGDRKADRESWYTRPIFSEALEARGFRSWGVKPVLQPTYAVREGSLKLIRFRTQGGYRYEFYDLSLDPGEKINLYDRNNPQAMRLQKHFTRYEAVSKTLRKNLAEPDTQDSQISPMDAEMLRALGYLE
jgi:arylsulfatase A-like enzyme